MTDQIVQIKKTTSQLAHQRGDVVIITSHTPDVATASAVGAQPGYQYCYADDIIYHIFQIHER